jgi:arginine decarboxylase
MQIHVGSGIGTGPTTMAAFDEALDKVGIANFNMLRLSSIVPPESKVFVHKGRMPFSMPGTWGDRMYLVMAEKRVDRHNAEAWAGVGWVQDKKTGRGMFTEHEGASEAFVRNEITQTLEALMEMRTRKEEFDWGSIQMVVVGQACTDRPVCALAVAVFQTSDWHNKPLLIEVEKKEQSSVKSRFWKSRH